MPYTFDFIDALGSIDHFELRLCADDVEAMRQAEAALRDSWATVCVDVWSDAARIGRIEGGPDRRAPAHLLRGRRLRMPANA